MMDSNKLIFICGVGRSGTSLMQSILNSHSKIAFLPETGILRRHILSNRLTRNLNENNPEQFINLFERDYRLNRLNINWEELWKQCGEIHTPIQLYRCIFTYKFHDQRIEYYGDKDPRLIEKFEVLKGSFPNAYIIHMVRDPRDVLLSKMNADWAKNKPYLYHILINNIQMKLSSDGTSIFGEQYLEVKYEQLLRAPEKLLKNVCKRLKLEYEPSMLDFTNSSKKLVSDEEIQWKKETMGPLLVSNFNKWKNGLSPWQAGLVETTMKNYMRHYGYQFNQYNISYMKKVIMVLLGSIINILSNLYSKIRRNVYFQ